MDSDFDDFRCQLTSLTPPVDPITTTPQAERIRAAVASLPTHVDTADLSAWVVQHPTEIPLLGLVVGINRERLIDLLRHRFGTGAWATLARTRPDELVTWMDAEFDLRASLSAQLNRNYSFADVLVERAGSRPVARRVDDAVEEVVAEIGVPHVARAEFVGRGGRTARAELVAPTAEDPRIVIAAKGLDHASIRVAQAVFEIRALASARQPSQRVLVVIDGLGWQLRTGALRRVYQHWADGRIDGLYTLSDLGAFRTDLAAHARELGLIPS